MNLRDQLNADLRDAMRAGEEIRRSTLRLLVSAVRNAEIPSDAPAAEAGAQRQELDDDAVLEVVKRQVKQRHDSIDAYEKAKRPDLVAREQAELEVLSAYLPAPMSRDEIAVTARRVIDEVGAHGPADKGKVMPLVIKELRDRADGRDINAVVTELLAQQ